MGDGIKESSMTSGNSENSRYDPCGPDCRFGRKRNRTQSQNKRIRAYRYKNEKQEIYYFVNEDETVYSGEIRVPHLGSCYAYDAWNGIKMVQEYRTDDESTTILSMKLRS